MDGIPRLNAEQRNLDIKEYILYHSISMNFMNRQNEFIAIEIRIVRTLE